MESNGQFQDFKQIFSVLETLNQQRQSSKLCDVILKISNEQIHAHSNILASASPYFDSVFSSHDLPRAFSQKMPQIVEIHIDGSIDPIYFTAVERIVDFMYTGRIHLDSSIVAHVLEISRIMEMDNVIEFCNSYNQGCPDIKEQTASYKVTKDMETQTAGGDVEKEIVVYNGNTSADKWTFKKNLKPKPKVFDGKRKRGRPRKKVPVVDESSVFIENVELENDECNQQTNMSEKENNQNNIDLDTECSKEGRRHHSVKEQTLRVSKHGRVIKPKRFSDDMVSFIKDEAESDMEVDAENNFTSSADLMEDGETKAKYDSLDYTVFKVENDEPVRKYACEQCEFSTSKMKEFIDHHREHLHAEKKCSYCGWVCDNPDITEEEFREHLNNHKGSNPYFCTFCSQRFDTRAKLYQHLPKHSKNRPYVCNICHAAFKWKQALKTHMIIHKGSKDYLCDICGFSTAHKPQLKAHHLIHTGNTFKCEEPGCDYQTTKRGNLKFHLMTHSREKPHQCELCGQAFSLVKNMKRHMLLHTTDRPFSCEKCSFNTTRLDKLKEHYFKQHQIGDKPKKKLRLTEYMKMQAMLEEIEQSHDQIETNVLNIGEGMETIELQVAEDTNGLTTTQIVNVTSSTGESIPIAITQNDGEVSYEIQQIPVQIVTQEIFTE